MRNAARVARNRHGHTCRQHDRSVLANSAGLAGHGQASQDRPSLHGHGLPADARTANLPARDGKPVLVRLPGISFIDDKAGQPVGINQHIGCRPIAAFGNSDGDIEMLQYTDSGK